MPLPTGSNKLPTDHHELLGLVSVAVAVVVVGERVVPPE